MRRLVSLILVVGLAGCSQTTPQSSSTTPAPTAAVLGDERGDTPPAALTATVEVIAPHASGIVVVNRRPVGPAPQRIEVAISPQGYLAEPTTVSLRFVARNVEEASMTIDEVLEMTDRPPERIVFSRDGARRQFGGVAIR